jgi:hypothetical protein
MNFVAVILQALDFLMNIVFKSEAWGNFQAAVHSAEATNMSGKEKFNFAFDKFIEFMEAESYELVLFAIHTGIQAAVFKLSLQQGKSIWKQSV